MPPYITEKVVDETPPEKITGEIQDKDVVENLSVDSTRKELPLPTLEEIRDAIPPECFKKSDAKSCFYLALDYVFIATCYLLLPYFEGYGGFVGLLGWYWMMGLFLSGLFMIGHDCGHDSFSDNKILNDIAGNLAYSPIMTPFWPIQKAHRRHHRHTNHVQKDRHWNSGRHWNSEEEFHGSSWLERQLAKFPLMGFVRWHIAIMLYGDPDGCYYWPFSKLFVNNTERLQCFVSTALCLACSTIAFNLCDYSAYSFVKYYFVPILFHDFWMVMVTTLQHAEDETEAYEEGTWTYLKGQAQTIDRKYGLVPDFVLHHITDGHVVHHFFQRIPHYNLVEATKAVRSLLEKYPGAYKYRSSPNYLLEFLRLNHESEYLIGKGSGVRKYNVSKEFAD
ncbi:fatty acid desaturase domain-containing protein [Ditylenchus destructor]|uniref:Fatty acid desaturase domain-containing protein n=1 Tax=Ditylenchus destructor TaxID=166010 RepID=A0AAD4QRV1_9BILA|nr:fatty acid desaturase domain-containing protein [Ditylenchus destructor]